MQIAGCTAIIDAESTRVLDRAVAYNNRSAVYLARRDTANAIADATRALEIDRGLASAYANRSAAYLIEGNYAQTIADASEAIRRSSSRFVAPPTSSVRRASPPGGMASPLIRSMRFAPAGRRSTSDWKAMLAGRGRIEGAVILRALGLFFHIFLDGGEAGHQMCFTSSGMS